MASLPILGGLLVVTSAGFLTWGISSRWRAKAGAEAAKSWATAQGVIVSSTVTEELPLWMSLASQGMARNYRYVPQVRYRYVVGREIEGKRLRFGSLKFARPERAQAALEPYPVGAEATVRYDPANPAESVLEVQAATGGSTAVIVSAAVAGIFGLLLAALAAAGFR